MKKAIFLIVTLATTFFCGAQDNSLLWKIEGNGLTKPSYLYGTIHMMCISDFQIKDKVAKAFENSDNLVLEINMSDPKEADAMQKTMQTDIPLSSLLTDSQKTEVSTMLKSQIGISLEQAEHISPFGLLTMSIFSVIPCSPTELKFYEAEFMAKAKAQNKTINGLETISSQMAAINKSYSLPEILKQIQLKNEYAKVFANMTKSYKEEDLPELYNLTRDRRFMDENAEQLILTDRNKAWTAKIPSIIKTKSTFFAVGAGHLYGKAGLIELLKQQGYKVTPVK